MNYENYIGNDYETRLNELKSLLNEAKGLLSDENISGILNTKFSHLSTELRGLITKINELKISETREHLEHYNFNQIQRVYAKYKNDLVDTLARNIDFESLFLANKEVFLNINEKHFKNELETLLNSNDTLNEAIRELEGSVDEVSENIKSEIEYRIDEIDLNTMAINILRSEIVNIARDCVNNNGELIAKETAERILVNVDFCEELVNGVLDNSIFKNSLKDALWTSLERLNEQAITRVLNHREMQKNIILQDLVMASLSLQNELKIISENMNFINDYKLIEKRKEFLENITQEDAHLILERKFKAV